MAGRHVEQNFRRLALRWHAKTNGVGAKYGFFTAKSRHQWTMILDVDEVKTDQARLATLLGVGADATNVMTTAQSHQGHSMFVRFRDRFIQCFPGNSLAESAMTVHAQHRAAVHPGLGFLIHIQ